MEETPDINPPVSSVSLRGRFKAKRRPPRLQPSSLFAASSSRPPSPEQESPGSVVIFGGGPYLRSRYPSPSSPSFAIYAPHVSASSSEISIRVEDVSTPASETASPMREVAHDGPSDIPMETLRSSHAEYPSSLNAATSTLNVENSIDSDSRQVYQGSSHTLITSSPTLQNKPSVNFSDGGIHDTATPGDALKLHVLLPSHVEAKKYEDPFWLPEDAAEKEPVYGPVTLKFRRTDMPQRPNGWKRYVTPEGNIYLHFRQGDKSIFTHADIGDPDQSDWIKKASKKLEDLWAQYADKLPPDTDIVLDFKSRGYYLTSWSAQCIFWLQDVEASKVTGHQRAPFSNIKYEMRSQFWKHVQMFPNTYVLTADCVEELRAIVTYGYGDIVSSKTSTFPYDLDTLNHIAHFIEKVKVDEPEPKPNPYYTSTIARYLDNLNHERYLHYHGELFARLSRHESVYHPLDTSHPLYFRFLSALLFFLPGLYLDELRQVYVDRTVHYYGWRRFVSELKEDWQESITPATVLISANVGFLAIQSVDSSTSYTRTVAQIASYASALLGLADYVVVQILMRRHRQHLYDTAARGLQHLSASSMETLALSMSLPGGLFNWSMLTFLLALEFVFYDRSTTATIATLSVIGGLLGIMIVVLMLLNRLAAQSHHGAALRHPWSLVRRYVGLPRGKLWKGFRRRTPERVGQSYLPE